MTARSAREAALAEGHGEAEANRQAEAVHAWGEAAAPRLWLGCGTSAAAALLIAAGCCHGRLLLGGRE